MISRETLRHLPQNVAGPAYDPSGITPGIVHFGVGNFFRAHLAAYVDDVMGKTGAHEWGIIGVGLTPGAGGAGKARGFNAQQGLYSLTEAAPDGTEYCRIIGSICTYLHAPEKPDEVLAALAAPSTRIVSMTITEGGYNIDEMTGLFRLDAPAIRQDLADPQHPKSFFGYVVEGLARRRDSGGKGFTVLSCDNLRHNGDVTRKAILSFAEARDAGLALWIAEHVTFPNAMVDRITPSMDDAAKQRLNQASGLEDDMPLIAETFTQWVVEDRFASERPRFEAVGAQLVDDVIPYENLKLRILNASHILLAFMGLLSSYETIDEALADDALRDVVTRFLDDYVLTDIEAPAGVDTASYKKTALERFSNSAMGDQNVRVGGDGASKIQVFWTETMRRRLKKNLPIDILAFGAASWLEALRGKGENGMTFQPFEPSLSEDDWARIRSDKFSDAFELSTFDGWRDVGDQIFFDKLVFYREVLRRKGFRAALSLL